MGATELIDEQRARVSRLVAAEQADVLLAPLREHFAGEPEVAVMVERRTANRADRPIAERDPARAIRRSCAARRPTCGSSSRWARAPHL